MESGKTKQVEDVKDNVCLLKFRYIFPKNY